VQEQSVGDNYSKLRLNLLCRGNGESFGIPSSRYCHQCCQGVSKTGDNWCVVSLTGLNFRKLTADCCMLPAQNKELCKAHNALHGLVNSLYRDNEWIRLYSTKALLSIFGEGKLLLPLFFNNEADR